MEGTSSSSAIAGAGNTNTVVINALTNRGWCFKDIDYLKTLITETISVIGKKKTSSVVDSVEAELLNIDIKLIGGKSLPNPTELRRCSHLQGPKVLQIVSVKDVTRSSEEEFLGSSNSKRVLKLVLSDGQIEISALEYSRIPSFNDDLAPGTKVRLENKAVVRDGLVCLTPKEVTVLGGYVQSLTEEWLMKRKYSRLSGRQSKESKGGGDGGPPPFEELQIRTGSHHRDNYKTTSRNVVPTVPESIVKHTVGEKGECSKVDGSNKVTDKNLQRNPAESDPKKPVKDENQEKPSSSDTRPKQVVEAVPVQNQAAAQILLEKMKNSSMNERGRRGRGRGRGRGRWRDEEDSAVLTLDEWEKRNTGGGVDHTNETTTLDEDLAWQLQNQFDLEDSYGHEAQGSGVADIRMNMFDYSRTNDDFGYGRGRGGRRGRGRGRGRF